MCPSNTKQIQRCSVRLSWRNLKEERTCEEKRKHSSDTQRLWRRRKVYNPDFIKAPWSGWILSLFIAQTLLYSGNRLTRSTQPTWFSSRTETVSLHTHIWSEPQDRYRQELHVRWKTVELKHLGERGGDILSSPSSFLPRSSWFFVETCWHGSRIYLFIFSAHMQLFFTFLQFHMLGRCRVGGESWIIQEARSRTGALKTCQRL